MGYIKLYEISFENVFLLVYINNKFLTENRTIYKNLNEKNIVSWSLCVISSQKRIIAIDGSGEREGGREGGWDIANQLILDYNKLECLSSSNLV
jgi:hypothetical protein